MADMTDEEYDALDEEWTRTTPKVNFVRPGAFAQQRSLLKILGGNVNNGKKNSSDKRT